MRFRTGVVVGIGIGYVLGARAGRHRYEQIRAFSRRARRHPAVVQLMDQTSGVTDLARSAVASGLREGSARLRNAADGTLSVEPSRPDTTVG